MQTTISLFMLAGLLLADKTPESAWMKVTLREGGFMVIAPGAPVEQPPQLQQVRYGRVIYHLYTLNTPNAFYYVAYAEMNNGKVDLPSYTFRDMRSKFLKSRKAEVTDERTVTLDGMYGSDLTAKTAEGGVLRVR